MTVNETEAVDFAMQFESGCRDCADRAPHDVCPNNGMPCEPDVRRAVMAHTVRAINYGLANGYLRAASKDAEPVAWQWRYWYSSGEPGVWLSERREDADDLLTSGILIREEKRPLFTHPSTGGEGGVRVKGREALIEAVADELVAHGEFSSIPGRNHANASKAAEAILPIILTAIEPVAASPGVPDGWPPVADVSMTGFETNPTYVKLVVEPKHAERREYRISIGAADVLFHELAAMSGLEAAPAFPEPSPAGGDVLAEGVDQLLAELKRWDRFVFGGTAQEQRGVGMMKQEMIERLTALRALSSKQRSEKE